MEKKGLTTEEYINELQVDKLNNDGTWGKYKDLLQIAIETRKFEIELYWKRAQYFWLFVSICFAAYYYTANKDYTSYYKQIENLIAAIGGYVLSICWFFVNRGSKYWQENWEQHIAVLTKHLGIPIFELLKSNKNHWGELMKSYPYSVSRINQIINLVIIIAWILLLGCSVYNIIKNTPCCCCWSLLSIFILIIITYLIHRFSRSFVIRERSDQSKDFFSNVK